MLNTLPEIKLQRINDKLFKEKKLKLYILRLDQTDQFISGNKWFKLKYNLIEAKKHNYQTLLTFGGAYSNHIHATAMAAKRNNFSSIGVIRGEATTPLNQTLTDARNMGMHLHFINRKDYRNKNNPDFLDSLIRHFSNIDNGKYGQIYLVPEGGSNTLALKGASEIPSLIDLDYEYLCLPCGTGGTLAGVTIGLRNQHEILGFPALKGADFLNNDINSLLEKYDDKYSQNTRKYNNWLLNLQYHFGGFGKKNQQLLDFIDRFYQQHHIELDFVYTGKMMFGIYELCQNNYFKANTSIVAIHTGGTQGNRSLTS